VNENSVVNIAGYKFEPLEDPVDLVSIYQQKCDDLKLKGTMLISKNGINFSLAGTKEATDTINGDNLRCKYDSEGNCIEVNPCWGDYRVDSEDACLSKEEHRAWSSPIYVSKNIN